MKDFGKWNLPTSYDDITLEQFQLIEKEEDKSLINILHILANKTRDEVLELPVMFVEKMLNKLTFLDTPLDMKPNNKIEVDGETYVINPMEKLKTGEYIAVDTIIKNDAKNYAAILAILCRKEGEKYDSKFEAEVFEKRMNMFLKQPISKIFPTVAFFLTLLNLQVIPSQLSSEVEEQINLTRQSIQNSQKIGGWKKYFMNYRLTKLEKSLRRKKYI